MKSIPDRLKSRGICLDKCKTHIEDEEDLSSEVPERPILVFTDDPRDVESPGIGWKDDRGSWGEVPTIRIVDDGELLS